MWWASWRRWARASSAKFRISCSANLPRTSRLASLSMRMLPRQVQRQPLASRSTPLRWPGKPQREYFVATLEAWVNDHVICPETTMMASQARPEDKEINDVDTFIQRFEQL